MGFLVRLRRRQQVLPVAHRGEIILCPDGDGDIGPGVADSALTRPQEAQAAGVTITNEPCDTDDTGTVVIPPAVVDAILADRVGTDEYREVKIPGLRSGSGPFLRVNFELCDGGKGSAGIMALMTVERAEAAGRQRVGAASDAG